MPYALIDPAGGKLFSRMQVNGYRLPYYGVVLWEEEPDAADIAEALSLSETAEDAAIVWQTVSLTEHQAKMANVKLRNDPHRQVRLADGALIAERTDASP